MAVPTFPSFLVAVPLAPSHAAAGSVCVGRSAGSEQAGEMLHRSLMLFLASSPDLANQGSIAEKVFSLCLPFLSR